MLAGAAAVVDAVSGVPVAAAGLGTLADCASLPSNSTASRVRFQPKVWGR